MEVLCYTVTPKLEEGDYRGTVGLACSDDKLADRSKLCLYGAQAEAPPTTSGLFNSSCICSVSAGGPDGLRPQHLKDMIGPVANSSSQVFLPALASFAELVLNGYTPTSIRPYFWCHLNCS